MHKKLKYIIFVLVLSIFCVNVEAAEVLKCEYIITTSTPNEMVNLGDLGHHEIVVTFKTNKFDIVAEAKARYVQNINLNKSVTVKEFTKMSLIQNPNLKDELQCYSYALLYYKLGNTDDTKGILGKGAQAEEVYLSNDYNALKQKAESAGRILMSSDGANKKNANAVIIRGESSFTSDEKNAAQKEVENAIATMKTYDYNMQMCRNDDDCSKCREKLEQYKKEISDFKSKEQSYENANLLSAEQISEFNTLYSEIFDTLLPKFELMIQACEINPDLEEGWGNASGTGTSGTSGDDLMSIPKTCTSCGNGALTDIPVQLPTFTRNLIKLLQVVIPLILIALGIYDFIRAIVASDEKLMQESQKRFIRRIIASVLIFFVIAIVKLLFGLIPGNVNTLGCVPCFTSDASSCGETYTCNY